MSACCLGLSPFFALVSTTLLALGMYLTLHWGSLAGLHHLLKASFCFGAKWHQVAQYPQAMPGVLLMAMLNAMLNGLPREIRSCAAAEA